MTSLSLRRLHRPVAPDIFRNSMDKKFSVGQGAGDMELNSGDADDPVKTDPRTGDPRMAWRVRVYDPAGIREFCRMGTLEMVEGRVLKGYSEIEKRGWSYEIMPVGTVPPGCGLREDGTVVALGR